jgi:hypothetical protein
MPRSTSPLVAEFTAALKASCRDCEPTFGALEGYLAGRLTVETLIRMSSLEGIDDASIAAASSNASLIAGRERFLDALFNSGLFQIGGTRLGPYGPACQGPFCNCNQGSHQVFMSRIQPLKTAGTGRKPIGRGVENASTGIQLSVRTQSDGT